MLTVLDLVRPKFSLTKNLISDQTFRNLVGKVNNPSFNVTYGLGLSTATSWVGFVTAGGFNDQRVTAIMRYRTPTAVGSENFGVILRVQCVETGDAASTDYYYARCNTGFARITKVVANAFTNLTSSAFALGQDADVTITFSVVGSALSATFDAGGSPATVNLSTTDASIVSGGLMGVRSTSQCAYCSSVIAEEL